MSIQDDIDARLNQLRIVQGSLTTTDVLTLYALYEELTGVPLDPTRWLVTASLGGGGGGSLPDPVTIAHGGTGATDAATARTDLGVAIGSDVEAHDADLDTIAALDSTQSGVVASDGAGWIRKTYNAVKTALSLSKSDVGLANVDNTSDATKNAAAVTLLNKTLTAPVINSPTGIVVADVSGAAPLASPTFTGTVVLPAQTVTKAMQVNAAANSFVGNNTGSPAAPSDLTVAQAKTLLALAVADVSGAAPLASPTFTGTTTVATLKSNNLTIGTPLGSAGTVAALAGSISVESGFLGLDFIATEFSGSTASLDLRGTRGTSLASPSHSLSGDVLGAIHIGGGTDAGLVDCAQIFCRATQDFSGTQSGTAWDFYTTTNGTNVKTVALTLDQNQSATFAGAVSVASGKITGQSFSNNNSTFTVGSSGALFCSGYTQGAFATQAVLNWRRADGASGSETKVLSGETLAALNFQGWNDTNGAYLSSAAIIAVAEQDFTTTGFRGTRLQFNTAPSSVNGGALVRLILDNAGKLWWGATTGAANAFVDQTGNASFGGTLLAGGNIGFNGKAAQALTGIAAPTATALRTAAPNATYSTTGGTGATAGAFDTAAHRDNVITDLANTMQRLGALITDLRANGTIG